MNDGIRRGASMAVRLLAIGAIGVAALVGVACREQAGREAAERSAAGGAAAPALLGAWARATVGNAGDTSAIYGTLANPATEADRLLSASAEGTAGVAQLHTTTKDAQGLMVMQQVPGIDVAAKGRQELAPGGYHIMLMNLPRQLKAGDRFNLTLNFQRAGTIVVPVEVRAITGATGTATMPGMGH